MLPQIAKFVGVFTQQSVGHHGVFDKHNYNDKADGNDLHDL
jgi:hypothetical protein